jgi:ParB/Sulfiredoxin domain
MRTETVPIDDVSPHPRNVRQGDVGAIVESLRAHGQYRAIVVQESTGHILAGNHTWKAARALGWAQIEATFVDVDDDEALRILLIDNRANDLASYDDPGLAELLKILAETERGLGGTGFDGDDLDALIRLVESTGDSPLNPYDEWEGMPDYETNNRMSAFHVTVHFKSEDDAAAFFAMIGQERRASTWWPEHDGFKGSDRAERWVGS